MKKIISIALMAISILAFQNPSHAQETRVGIGEIIFEESTPEIAEHGFLMNDLSYTIIKMHLTIAEKNIETADYE
jgi:hypothetical protein